MTPKFNTIIKNNISMRISNGDRHRAMKNTHLCRTQSRFSFRSSYTHADEKAEKTEKKEMWDATALSSNKKSFPSQILSSFSLHSQNFVIKFSSFDESDRRATFYSFISFSFSSRETLFIWLMNKLFMAHTHTRLMMILMWCFASGKKTC